MIKRRFACLIFLIIFLLTTGKTFAQKLNKHGSPQHSAAIKNFDKNGRQITRFSSAGDALDAHDGEIAYFNQTYYLYGTSYDCGFEWGNKGAPFCGFKVYSSADMKNWTDRGFLFDAQTPVWQSRCDGKTYGCFRPHVVYNQKTKLYVLWINVYDNVIGYRVFTSKTPAGPFTEMAEPNLAVNNNMPPAGLNNGDHDLFVDDDGTAYLAFTDWRTKGTIVIEKLSADYLTGTGEHVKAVTDGNTEAPGMFKRNGIYYVVYSDPNCGYCSGTGASYRTAKSPLGPWSAGIKISDNSCGGQPSFVSTIKLKGNTVYLFGSDLWNNAAKNEALANFYWAQLTFSETGAINPLVCQSPINISSEKAELKNTPLKKNLDNSSGIENFSIRCDINKDLKRSQTFTAKKSGVLTGVSFTTFKTGSPDAALIMELFEANIADQPIGSALFKKEISADKIGWSPKNIQANPEISVEKGKRYAIVVRSVTQKGCYGVALNEEASYPGGGSAIRSNNSKEFTAEKNRTLKFETFIK